MSFKRFNKHFKLALAQATQPADLNTQTDVIVAGQRLNPIQQQIRQLYLDLLYVRTFGRWIDANYEAFCFAMWNDYLDQHCNIDYTQRRFIIDGLFEEHLRERLDKQIFYTPKIINRINQLNEDLIGVTYIRPWYYLGLVQKRITLTPREVLLGHASLRGIAPTPVPIYFSSLSLVTLGFIAVGSVVLTVTLITSRVARI